MITHIRIQNYRSFVDAEVDLRPFSLVIGANGSGKTNLLRFLVDATQELGRRGGKSSTPYVPLDKIGVPHVNFRDKSQELEISFSNGGIVRSEYLKPGQHVVSEGLPWGPSDLTVHNLDPTKISGPEPVVPFASVSADGIGTAQVLESLKNGDREDLFDKIEENFRCYVPEVEKLSLRTVGEGKKQIQVREKGLKEPLPATEVSEGTRLVLCILTILHQEKPPPVILLEDIDRGMHPRIFESVVPLMRDIAERHDINIIATTHNPYLVDCFQDDKEAVIIVEKKDGASTLDTLASRLEGLDYDKIDPDDMPLGNLWYSGLVGGVPLSKARRPAHKE